MNLFQLLAMGLPLAVALHTALKTVIIFSVASEGWCK